MNTQLRSDFQRFLYHGPALMVGRQAELALRDARILARWRELEAQGKVRLTVEPEQESYFDVYGEPDSERERKALEGTLENLGCYWVASEYLSACTCGETEEWEQADSIGMCVYEDPTDPFENCYVIDLMDAAIKASDQKARY